MKINKLTLNKAGDALLLGGSAAVGIAGSNVGVQAVDSFVKNKMASRGIVAALGLVTAIAIPNKNVAALGAGMVSKQVFEVVKDLAEDSVTEAGILADALEIDVIQPASQEAMAALNRALAGRSLGNPNEFRLGNPQDMPINNGFQVG